MIYTLVSRTNTGYMNQKVNIEGDLHTASFVSRLMFLEKNIIKVEIYEDRVPKGDCWGKPVKTVNREEEPVLLEI